MGSMVSDIISQALSTETRIGKVQLGWNTRVILDDVSIKDQKDKPMLEITRLGAKLSLWDILHGYINIDNAQLFGMRAQLYQEHPDSTTNFKFLIDALASKDTTKHTPLNLHIGQIQIRHTEVHWNQLWKPQATNRFNPNHLNINNLSITAQINALTDDSVNIEIKKLSFDESCGFSLNNMHLAMKAGKSGAMLRNFDLACPHSNIAIPEASLIWQSFPSKNIGKEWLENIDWKGEIKGHIDARDIDMFLYDARKHAEAINLQLSASGKGRNARINDLQLTDTKKQFILNMDGMVNNINKDPKTINSDITLHKIFVGNELLDKLYPKVAELGCIEGTGHIKYANEEVAGNIEVQTDLGNCDINGKGTLSGVIDATINTDGFQTGTFTKEQVDYITMKSVVKGRIKGQRGKPELDIRAKIGEIGYKGYHYHNIDIAAKCKGDAYEGNIFSQDPNAELAIDAALNLASHTIHVDGEVSTFCPNDINLTEKFPGSTFSGNISADLTGEDFDNMQGHIFLDKLTLANSEGTYSPGDIHITSMPKGDQRHILLISPFLETQVTGHFKTKSLIGSIHQMASNYLPTIITSQGHEINAEDKGEIAIRLYDATPLQKFLGIDLELQQPLFLQGQLDMAMHALNITANAPSIRYGNENLSNIALRMESNRERIQSTIALQRSMKGVPVDIKLTAQSEGDILKANFAWDNRQTLRRQQGEIRTLSQLSKDENGHQSIYTRILPTEFIVGDTIWNMHPGYAYYHEGKVHVDSMQVSSDNRFLKVNGKASSLSTDTLQAELHNISLAYIFKLVNFRAVDFDGAASGDVIAHSLFKKPYADAFLTVDKFSLNNGELGDMLIYGNWGKKEKSILLDADIYDAPHQGRTQVKGSVTLGHGPGEGLDLNINAKRTNIYFLNKFTSAIFDDLQGRVSGWARLFGPFKKLNVEGDLLAEEGEVGIPLTGVRYHLQNDSVTLRPNNIYFSNADIYDMYGNPDKKGHRGSVNGHLHHNNFSNMSYDININAENILGYDFKEFGDLTFCGTVYASGDVRLNGEPGRLDIDIKAHPEQGTTITYNASSPESVTESQFITYVDRKAKEREKKDSTENTATLSPTISTSDIRINFDLDIDNKSSMNLLMDAKAGDNISLNGNGKILASYYNKGDFLIYGTYNVERGIYKLSLQEVIRKDFTFQNGGTIVFGGNPMEADLNLQAIYTVPSVSLNDLSARSNLSNSTVRVNCLMNVGGKAQSPLITFDFDIPNVNEDEKQMVRSLINTEEERNMQVIYLLSIGRFYTYDYSAGTNTQNQSYSAMNSLLSSTLSGQLNQVLSSMIHNNNWNVGTNLSTGDMGWSDMDVEGLLSGRMLNNRLLFNGQFGYRDNPVTNSNFVGDFDLQYLLTPRGTVSLKAYSETNDRYFTKSALTTQGIGIGLKKDFSNWKNLFKKP